MHTERDKWCYPVGWKVEQYPGYIQSGLICQLVSTALLKGRICPRGLCPRRIRSNLSDEWKKQARVFFFFSEVFASTGNGLKKFIFLLFGFPCKFSVKWCNRIFYAKKKGGLKVNWEAECGCLRRSSGETIGWCMRVRKMWPGSFTSCLSSQQTIISTCLGRSRKFNESSNVHLRCTADKPNSSGFPSLIRNEIWIWSKQMNFLSSAKCLISLLILHPGFCYICFYIELDLR